MWCYLARATPTTTCGEPGSAHGLMIGLWRPAGSLKLIRVLKLSIHCNLGATDTTGMYFLDRIERFMDAISYGAHLASFSFIIATRPEHIDHAAFDKGLLEVLARLNTANLDRFDANICSASYSVSYGQLKRLGHILTGTRP